MRTAITAAILAHCVSAWLFPFVEEMSPGEFASFGKFALYAPGDVPGSFNSTISIAASVRPKGSSDSVVLVAITASEELEGLMDTLGVDTVQELAVCCWLSPCSNVTIPDTFVQRLTLLSQPINNETDVLWVTGQRRKSTSRMRICTMWWWPCAAGRRLEK